MTAPAEAQATPAAAPTGAALEQVLSRPIPADWTVSKALDTYLAVNGFTRAEYDRPWVEVTFWSFTFPFPNPPSGVRWDGRSALQSAPAPRPWICARRRLHG